MSAETETTEESRLSGRGILLTLATAVVYFVAAKLGLRLAFVAEQVTVFWPATGMALAALLLLGSRVWPGIALGAFLANATANEPILVAAGIAVGNTLEAVAGAWMLRALNLRTQLDRLRDAMAIMIAAALGSTLLSATVGAATLCLGGLQPWERFGAIWWVWWIGDAMGDLVLAPFLLVWSNVRDFDRARLRESALILGMTMIASFALFGGAKELHEYPLHYAAFLFVVWAALRLGPMGTSAATLVVSSVAISSTAGSLGPSAMASVHHNLVVLQLFLAVVAVTGLVLGAAIAERNRSEEQRAAELAGVAVIAERLRLALDAARLGVWDWNLETGAIEWTDNLEPIHGMPRGSFDGTFEAFRRLIHPDDQARVNEAIQNAIDGKARYDIEFRNVWPDGTLHWMAAEGNVVRARDGRAVRFLGTAMDITERKRLEDELREQARQLVEADRRKDEFLAMLAHELRNPLAPLRTSLYLLREDVERRDRYLDMAERQVRHLVRIVDDLLDISRITRGTIVLRKGLVPLADVVKRSVELTRPLLDERGHSLEVRLPAAPVYLRADDVRLVQAFGNLLGNAASYTPTGGSISVVADTVGDEVRIAVRDNGVGLSADLLPKVFDLFVQGDASLDRTLGGLGIGLTLVRAVVELHGGRVEAHSAGIGEGSEFVVYLPIEPAGESTERTAEASRTETPSDGLRILVVEDNPDTAEGFTTLLEIWGHKALFALDGRAALSAADAFCPEVVICDLGLPGMDGYQLARTLRRRPALRGAVLIALSGYGRDEDKKRAAEAGFDHHLVKPADLDAIADLLVQIASSRAHDNSNRPS